MNNPGVEISESKIDKCEVQTTQIDLGRTCGAHLFMIMWSAVGTENRAQLTARINSRKKKGAHAACGEELRASINAAHSGLRRQGHLTAG
jgi:hypothetical protein